MFSVIQRELDVAKANFEQKQKRRVAFRFDE